MAFFSADDHRVASAAYQGLYQGTYDAEIGRHRLDTGLGKGCTKGKFVCQNHNVFT